MSVNKVILLGHLGGDPEVRYFQDGTPVCNFSLATSESWKDKQTGQVQKRTEWHRVVFFGKLAEIAGQYLRKGSKIYIEGRLQTREWEKDGVKRYTTEIIVDMRGAMQMLDSRGDGGGNYDQSQGFQPRPQQQQPAAQPAASQPQPQYEQRPAPAAQIPPAPAPAQSFDNFDDDIPF